MPGKKWFCCLFILICIAVWGALTNLWAGERELIELLKKKNIITQQAADQLLDEVAYFGTNGQGNTNFTAGNGRAGDFLTWQIQTGQISLQYLNFTIMGQYWGKGTKASTEENNQRAYQVTAFVRVPSAEKLRIFGKAYRYDSNTNKIDDDYTVYVTGLSYELSKEFMPYFAWEHRDNGANAGAIDNKYQIGFQLKF